MRWFGHLMRMNQETPARLALREAQKPSKNPRGRPKTTWIKMMKTTLKEHLNLKWEEASEQAQDRDRWRALYCGGDNTM